ncbi:MAG: glycosyltransferase [Gemmatimonas sp.]|nr:glycosyltransferase [Gemmatimonas sp.]
MNGGSKAESSDSVRLSIVIPTLNEGPYLGGLLEDVARLRISNEVIVVDGGSSDNTANVASAAGAEVLTRSPGRGEQLRAGAEAASGLVLCFLHADVRLEARAREEIESYVATSPPYAVAFRLQIDAPGLVYRLLERGANLRSRLLGLPYGDQGLLLSREAYERAGGYPSIPIMEDVALVRRLRQSAGLRLLRGRVIVSPRRWLRDGPITRTVINLSLLIRYLAGASPHRLARRYRPETLDE